MRVFKTKWFTRYAKRVGLDDKTLCEAIKRAERGLIDAGLRGYVIKQRVAKEGQGRSKGYRVLIAYRQNKRAVFLYCFAKNELDNIEDDVLESLKEMAEVWIDANDPKIEHSLNAGALQEVKYDKKI